VRSAELPKVNQAAHPQAALPASGARDRPGLQDRSAFPEQRHDSPARGKRGLSGWTLNPTVKG